MTTTTILKGQCRCPRCKTDTDLEIKREEKANKIAIVQRCTECRIFMGQSVFTFSGEHKPIIPKEVEEAVGIQENVERANPDEPTEAEGIFKAEEPSGQ